MASHCPLILNSDGTKFGKTAAGAIWVDSKKTSVYRFYQFWIRCDDRDVVRYLNLFTFLSRRRKFKRSPSNTGPPRIPRRAQGFGGGDDRFGAWQNRHSRSHPRQRNSFWRRTRRHRRKHLQRNRRRSPFPPGERIALEGAGVPLGRSSGGMPACPSKGQARKDIQGGGVYVNNIREPNPQRAVTANDFCSANTCFSQGQTQLHRHLCKVRL